MSTVFFVLFVVMAAVGIALQVRARGQLRLFVIGSILVVTSLPVFAVAWVQR